MKIITTTDDLAAFCAAAAAHPFVTVDTEFLRERTYYAQLCLVQLAFPGTGDENAALIDPLADGLSLDPLYDLFRDESVVKVFHAARQDLEIFFVDAGVIPKPLFDSQVAAMVCGFGDQVSYEALVRKITKRSMDKSSRFTDWSRRPLSQDQQTYALADVTHLRDVYLFLSQKLARTGRAAWVEEELAILTDPQTYITDPATAWRRVKTRNTAPRFMAQVMALAEFRETYAQGRNIPRSRVFKDDALLEIASLKPQSESDLGKSRLLLREARKGEIAAGILKAVAGALSLPREALPKPTPEGEKLQVNPALADLLRVLLKAKTDQHDVAPKLLANSADLDALAAGKRDVMALQGWRADVFGNDALRLCNGEVGLAVQGERVVLVAL
jgi:ribonuclease D